MFSSWIWGHITYRSNSVCDNGLKKERFQPCRKNMTFFGALAHTAAICPIGCFFPGGHDEIMFCDQDRQMSPKVTVCNGGTRCMCVVEELQSSHMSTWHVRSARWRCTVMYGTRHARYIYIYIQHIINWNCKSRTEAITSRFGALHCMNCGHV